MAVELATGYVSIVPTTTGIAGGLSKILGGPAAAAGTTAGKQAGAGVTSGVASGTSGVGSIIKKNAVLPLLGVGVAAFASAKDVEDAQNTIIRSTGATGKAADSLRGSFKNVAGSTPADFKTVGEAIAEVHQRTGLYGKGLETLALQTITFNRITKDSPLNVQEFTKTMAGFNVPAKDMGKELDNIFRVSQQTGVPVADLISTLGSAGPVLRQLKLPLGESASLIAQLNKAGIDGTAIIPGLRKAIIGFAKEGKDPAKGVRDLLGSIDGLIKTGKVDQARAIAANIFGARGVGIVDAAVQGKLKIDDLAKGLNGLTGKGILDTASATGTLSGKLGVLKNQAELALAQIGSPILGTFTDLLKSAIPVVAGIGTSFAHLPGPVKQAAAGIVALAVLRGPLTRVGSTIAGIGKAGLAAGKAIVTGAAGAAGGVGRLVGGFRDANVAQSAFSGRLGTLGGKLRSVVGSIGSAGKATAGWAKSLLDGGKAALQSALGIAKQAGAFVAQKAAAIASAIATKAMAAAQWVLNAAMDANPITLIVIGIAALVAGFILAYQHIGFFRDAVDAVWGVLQSVASFIGDVFVAAFDGVVSVFQTIAAVVSTVWNGIAAVISTVVGIIAAVISTYVGIWVAIFQTAWSLISGAVSIAWGVITGIVNLIVNTVQNVIRTGMTIAVGIWNTIWGGFTGVVRGVIGGIEGAVKSVINVVIRGINFLIRAWNSLEFEVPSIDVGPVHLGGGTIGTPNIPTIPQLAEGAFVLPSRKGTTVNVAEAGVPETVLPLPKLKSLVALAGGSPGQAPVVVYVDAMVADARAGRTIGEALDKHFAAGGTAGRGLGRGN